MPDDSGRLRDAPGPAHAQAERPGRTRPHAATAVGATALLGAAIWLSTLVRLGPVQREVALFVHLGFLILGFGAVLVVDYFFALWILGRTTLAEALAGTSRLHLLVWSGVAGLIVSGALLRPNLTSAMTILKLVLVAGLIVNGVLATALDERMRAVAGVPSARLLLCGGLVAAVSQISWWGTVVIGFLNTRR